MTSTDRLPRITRPPGARGHLTLWGCVIALFAGIAAGSDDDASQARALMHKGTILPLEYFIHQALRIHPGKVIEAELDHEEKHGGYVYEVEILDLYGRIWEIEFDAQTGELVEKELGGDH
jgi:uncharacterized membrane protein YkoI